MNPLNNYASQDHEAKEDSGAESDEKVDKLFKIVLSEPKPDGPDGVKISAKNVCIITII